METLQVKCPDCDAVLIVDRKSGKVLEVRRPIVENPSGDRFEDAHQRVLGSKDRAEQKFEEAKAKQKTRMSELDKLFKARAEELKDQPIERPDGLFDRD
ncbi:MAG: hypothetical protein SF028_01335 [Candidatus Sumerlaeia bacterium]|nr:hypothetical protein [Candidatus Sumerlaeia bacterium]